jgi:hypothetical protein
MMKLYFATLFDINYLTRGLALIQSLQKYCSVPFKIFVLSLDEKVEIYFSNNPVYPVEIILLSDIEDYYSELTFIKSERKNFEYFFTLSPYLPSYIIENYREVDRITTVDSDILFFSDPAVIFQTYSKSSILITPHDFSINNLFKLKWGIYNVSFQSFRRDEQGLECLKFWRQQCYEWCYDEIDETVDRYADQKYLDKWPILYNKLQVINIKGAGLAPWNIEKYKLSIKENQIFVNDSPLIYYHFHKLRLLTPNFASHSFGDYYTLESANSPVVKKIYKKYIKILNKFQKYNLFGLDTEITRDSNMQYSVFKRIIKTNGVWYVNSHFLIHFNFIRILSFLNKIRYIVKCQN